MHASESVGRMKASVHPMLVFRTIGHVAGSELSCHLSFFQSQVTEPVLAGREARRERYGTAHFASDMCTKRRPAITFNKLMTRGLEQLKTEDISNCTTTKPHTTYSIRWSKRERTLPSLLADRARRERPLCWIRDVSEGFGFRVRVCYQCQWLNELTVGEVLLLCL